MPDSDRTVHCWIYKSLKKDEMYLYVREEQVEGLVPESLLNAVGRLEMVMELDLHPGRPLAREDVNQVIDHLLDQGFYLQMPPRLAPELNDSSDGF
ncbi:MAG: YcgL domain-containing protein [Gammaproteobacteria bacterium]